MANALKILPMTAALPKGARIALPKAATEPSVANLSLVHPAIPAISTSPALLNGIAAATQLKQAAAGQVPTPLTVNDLLDMEHELRLFPTQSLGRHFRVYYVPVTVKSGVATAQPQRRCVPIKLVIPQGATQSYVQQMQAGLDQYFAQNAQVPTTMFNEGVFDVGWLRPVVLDVGQTFTFSTGLADGTPVGLIAFDLGEEGMLSSPLGNMRSIGFGYGSTAIADGGTSWSYSISPQKNFRLRRIAFDDSVNHWNGASIQVTSVTVANDPQTENNGVLPGAMMARATPNGFIDGDVCPVGAQIVISGTNSDGANAIVVQGEVIGDTEE